MHHLHRALLGSSLILVACRVPPQATPTPGTVALPSAEAPSSTVQGPPAGAPSGSSVAVADPPGGDLPSSFLDAWPQIYELLLAGRAEELVEPSLGLVVIDNPGAFIIMERFPSFAKAFATRPLAGRMEACALRRGPYPEFSCETNLWTPDGCVLTDPSHPELSRIYEDLFEFVLDPGNPPDPAEVERYERLEALVTVTVTDTSRATRWHFGSVNGRLRLLVVDVVAPCSA